MKKIHGTYEILSKGQNCTCNGSLRTRRGREKLESIFKEIMAENFLIMLSKISQKKKDKHCMISLICGI